MNRSDTPTDLTRTLTRRVRDDEPLRLETETLHRLADADLARVAGGKPGTTGRPSRR